jgi:hypothetical protein
LWGLAWGALVFGELVHFSNFTRIVILTASAVMILGALAISTTAASVAERDSCVQAIARECRLYDMDLAETVATQDGAEPVSSSAHRRRWWDYAILLGALAVFVRFAFYASRPPLAISYGFASLLIGVMLLFLIGGGWALWKYTRFA